MESIDWLLGRWKNIAPVCMTPSKFLEITKDWQHAKDFAPERVYPLIRKIEKGIPIDPPVLIYENAKTLEAMNGRHRSIAAHHLQIPEMIVIVAKNPVAPIQRKDRAQAKARVAKEWDKFKKKWNCLF